MSSSGTRERNASQATLVSMAGGASTRIHPAPYREAFAERLVPMFSLVGDTVLDSYVESGTANVAATSWGRTNIGFESESEYVDQILDRARTETVTNALTVCPYQHMANRYKTTGTKRPIRVRPSDEKAQDQNARKPLRHVGISTVLFVAGAGFEPATFGL